MKRKLIAIFILLIGTSVLAQQDQKAKNILDQVSKKTKSFTSISARFSFSMENIEENIKEKNNGSLNLKGDKYMVELPDLGVEVYSDGETIWSYQADGNQVSITSKEDGGQELMDPATIFQIYEKGFDYKFIEEKKEKGKPLYYIDLIPQSDELDYSKVTICINKNTLMIDKAIMYGFDGNLYGIEVTKMETNKPMDEKMFVFNASKYPDIEVIDFR